MWRSILSITDKSVILEIPPWVTSILLFTTVARGSQPNMSAKSFMTFAECSYEKQHNLFVANKEKNKTKTKTELQELIDQLIHSFNIKIY